MFNFLDLKIRVDRCERFGFKVWLITTLSVLTVLGSYVHGSQSGLVTGGSNLPDRDHSTLAPPDTLYDGSHQACLSTVHDQLPTKEKSWLSNHNDLHTFTPHYLLKTGQAELDKEKPLVSRVSVFPSFVFPRINSLCHLHCNFEAPSGQYHIHWYRGNLAEIPIDDTGRRLSVYVKDLHIEEFYWCKVTVNNRTILSQPSRVSTARMAENFLIHPSGKRLVEGRTLILRCAVESQPLARYVWSRDSQPVSGVHALMPGVLMIESFTAEDAGSYKCIATNLVTGEVRESFPALVTVEESSPDIPPSSKQQYSSLLSQADLELISLIIVQLRHCDSPENGEFHAAYPKEVLKCGSNFKCDYRPVSLRKFRRPLMIPCVASEIKGSTSSWIIPQRHLDSVEVVPLANGQGVWLDLAATPNSDTVFTCEISNSRGKFKYTMKVPAYPTTSTVHHPLLLKKQKSILLRSKQLRLASGTTLTWMKNGSPIILPAASHIYDHSNKLFIGNLNYIDSGLYQYVVHSRSITVVSTLANITVLPPVIIDQYLPRNIVVFDVNTTWAYVKWKQPATNDTIIGYSVNYWPADTHGKDKIQKVTSETSLGMFGLESGTEYRLIVKAAIGMDFHTSKPVSFTTRTVWPKPAAVSAVCVIQLNASAVNVTWDQVPLNATPVAISYYRVMMYNAESPKNVSSYLVSSNHSLHHVVTNLQMNTTYKAFVEAISDIGTISEEKREIVFTLSDPELVLSANHTQFCPSPLQITLNSPSTLSIAWNDSACRWKSTTQFKVNYKQLYPTSRHHLRGRKKTTKTVSTTAGQISGLEPGSFYQVSLAANGPNFSNDISTCITSTKPEPVKTTTSDRIPVVNAPVSPAPSSPRHVIAEATSKKTIRLLFVTPELSPALVDPEKRRAINEISELYYTVRIDQLSGPMDFSGIGGDNAHSTVSDNTTTFAHGVESWKVIIPRHSSGSRCSSVSVIIDSLLPGAVYQFGVNSHHNSITRASPYVFSNWVQITYPEIMEPGSLNETIINNTAALLSWQTPAQSTNKHSNHSQVQYSVVICSRLTDDKCLQMTTGRKSIVVGGLTQGRQYSWYVRANWARMWSEKSATNIFSLHVTSPNVVSGSVNWSVVAGVLGGLFTIVISVVSMVVVKRFDRLRLHSRIFRTRSDHSVPLTSTRSQEET